MQLFSAEVKLISHATHIRATALSLALRRRPPSGGPQRAITSVPFHQLDVSAVRRQLHHLGQPQGTLSLPR
jgi:hypothetical protein